MGLACPRGDVTGSGVGAKRGSVAAMAELASAPGGSLEFRPPAAAFGILVVVSCLSVRSLPPGTVTARRTTWERVLASAGRRDSGGCRWKAVVRVGGVAGTSGNGQEEPPRGARRRQRDAPGSWLLRGPAPPQFFTRAASWWYWPRFSCLQTDMKHCDKFMTELRVHKQAANVGPNGGIGRDWPRPCRSTGRKLWKRPAGHAP